MTLKGLLRSRRHLIPSIDDGGHVRYVRGTCDEESKIANAAHFVNILDDKDSNKSTRVIITCADAQDELDDWRWNTTRQGKRISELEAQLAVALEKITDMERVQAKAILVALNAGRQIAENLRISEDWPIAPVVADGGKAVEVELPGVTLLFMIFSEELTVHLKGTTEVATYPMRDGEFTREAADAIGGKLRRAGWDDDKSLPSRLSLTGVVSQDG
jgi:hypothetical protein